MVEFKEVGVGGANKIIEESKGRDIERFAAAAIFTKVMRRCARMTKRRIEIISRTLLWYFFWSCLTEKRKKEKFGR